MNALPVAQCSDCLQITYPIASSCSACGRSGCKIIELTEGTLYTFTCVYVAAPGMKTPYALGYVDFAEGARILGRIEPAENLKVGMRVRVVANENDFVFTPGVNP